MATESGRIGSDIAWIVRAVRKHLIGIALLVGLAVMAAAAYAVLREDEYAAYTEILIEPAVGGFSDLDEEQRNISSTLEPEEMETALKLVTSGRTLNQVIDQLNLQFEPTKPTVFENVFKSLFQAEALEVDQDERRPKATALRFFREKLDIGRDPLASIISIGYRSTDPEEAARVANTVANIYLAERLAAKRQLASRTADHLDERVKEMAAWLRNAESNIEQYKADADLYEVSGAAPVEQRYAKLADQLTEANIALTEAQARLSQADGAAPLTS